MSVVKINAISVPEGAGPDLEERFAARARSVETMAGFEDFQLLRPVEGEDRYFVYTRWDSEESFQAWVQSQAFAHGHARAESADGKPVASGASLLAFEVVQHVTGSAPPAEEPSPAPAEA
jgi:heme-degrading monooxygenase HmoA